jgi:hypothetical protein
MSETEEAPEGEPSLDARCNDQNRYPAVDSGEPVGKKFCERPF